MALETGWAEGLGRWGTLSTRFIFYLIVCNTRRPEMASAAYGAPFYLASVILPADHVVHHEEDQRG